jgi:hypothetical protein
MRAALAAVKFAVSPLFFLESSLVQKTNWGCRSPFRRPQAKLVVIGEEDPAEFEEFRAGLLEQYNPQGPAESELVEYLAGVYWRLRRFPFFEAAIFAAREAQVANELKEEKARLWRLGEEQEQGDKEEDEMSNAEWLVRVGRALIKDGAWSDAFSKLVRHEATQLNALRRTLSLLEEMQGSRQCNPVNVNAMPLDRAA